MKRVIIICEGETEKEFCTKLLSPYFIQKNILIQSPLIKKSMGGVVKWNELKKQILLHLQTDHSALVTTLIDNYGLYQKHQFPGWEKGLKIQDKKLRVGFLERAMADDIIAEFRYRYLPYLQLHEFEGLLFNNLQIFYDQIPKDELVGIEELTNTLDEFADPEMINDQRETSPSHRLKRIIKGYNKVIYGNYLA